LKRKLKFTSIICTHIITTTLSILPLCCNNTVNCPAAVVSECMQPCTSTKRVASGGVKYDGITAMYHGSLSSHTQQFHLPVLIRHGYLLQGCNCQQVRLLMYLEHQVGLCGSCSLISACCQPHTTAASDVGGSSQ